ncbi:hypothetical protein LY28_00008 [Ruminiclostridium sufflavum DSM 19573]|uniref:Fibronectin type-III domain-containing protein n=1 Tax=Ruminiclostridium sufflavum DSM 19573 TaxID=1121337 RepID=A0A318Y3I3_9FIRM|nr:hypothetical protein [Ruminiclostridium sufflavum]PYG90128.1 hypothetical protein LY28_00008 [Ruminiclostridium sufflavum DSM 19573]
MKNFSKSLSFIVVFIAMMAVMCSVSFAEEQQYTENLIPVMTSNTEPSGIVTSSNSDANWQDWKAFDRGIGAGKSWMTNNYAQTGWLAYEFPTSQVITKYTITPYLYLDENSPKNWTFEGWDGSQWIVLDQRTDINGWSTKKEFTFQNSTAYIKYRINVTALAYSTSTMRSLVICELEMMGPATASVLAPTNLAAVPGNAKVDLSWTATTTTGTAIYNVKRATTAGGPYTTIASNVTETTYTDTAVTNGTTYYYVVSAVIDEVESPNSNEASAMPTEPVITGNSAVLEITMTNGQIKEYDLTAVELQSFLTWYDGSANGTDKAYYILTKKNGIKPFLSRKEYIAFDKISSFEVKEYAE